MQQSSRTRRSALVTKEDLRRITTVANETRCRIEVTVGSVTVRVIPDDFHNEEDNSPAQGVRGNVKGEPVL